jgi:integrase
MGNRVGNKATDPVLLKRTAHPGVYRRGAQYVAVYRRDGRQRKESAATFAEARAIKLARDAEASEERRGPTLHAYALTWVACHAGSGHDAVREQTREEYRRLLATFALAYFPASLRLADIDRRVLQGFIGWLTDRPGRRGRLSDRSIRNALTPLRLCLDAGAREGLLDGDLVRSLVLPSRRGGGRWEVSERRCLTRQQLGRLLAEIPKAHGPLFMLLASTGLRISEAIALRWCDLDLDASPPRLRVRRAIVKGTSVRRSRVTAPAPFPWPTTLPSGCVSYGRPKRRPKISYSAVATGGRSNPATSGTVSSRLRPCAQACQGSVCTRCVTHALRC